MNKSSFYITTTSGMRGHFAVMIERDAKGFEQPYITSPCSYDKLDDATIDAKAWAEVEGLQYRE